MAPDAAFCLRQEAAERDRASAALLPNVKIIATRAAAAWAREASRAERIAKKTAARILSSRAADEESRQFSENPDSGYST